MKENEPADDQVDDRIQIRFHVYNFYRSFGHHRVPILYTVKFAVG